MGAAPVAAGQQLVCAWAWCWPASVPQRAGGACLAADVDLVLQLVMAVAGAALRASAAIGDLAVIRCWRGPGAGGAGQQQEGARAWFAPQSTRW